MILAEESSSGPSLLYAVVLLLTIVAIPAALIVAGLILRAAR